MSGKQTGTHVVAQCQAWLMRLGIYDGSVWGQARDPFEWFPSDTLDLGLGATGFDQGWALSGLTYPPLPVDQRAPATRGTSLALSVTDGS
jgi:hypothetical protein